MSKVERAAAPQDRLGEVVRSRRERLGIGVRELARATGLSPSFISQMERGLVRPRITSLHLVARELDTTAQSLLAEADPVGSIVTRAGEAPTVEHTDDPDSGVVRTLVAGARGLTAMEITGAVGEFGDPYEHPGEELLIVVRGRVEVEVGEERHQLGAGDAICYDGRIPHRSRRLGAEPTQIYLITTRDDRSPSDG
ncbi:MAG TPA: XRE family transcriptional regulator [Acidimicrobiales bacterium]|nr:XRE family transcriptional regulator [Acidimicrobiales bacterium]